MTLLSKHSPTSSTSWRYAKVLKTVARIVIDEDENGLVIEKWSIKNHSVYAQ